MRVDGVSVGGGGPASTKVALLFFWSEMHSFTTVHDRCVRSPNTYRGSASMHSPSHPRHRS